MPLTKVSIRSASESHPRPILARAGWVNLNGSWEFGIGPDEAAIDRRIKVPFAPETPASGIEAKGFFERCWYRRSVDVPELNPQQRLFLHFEAVDYISRVWVDGVFVGLHEGGYTRFGFDITGQAQGKKQVTILVCCDDDPHDLNKPRGKQDWLESPHSIWYPRTTGIWQTVWLEVAPAARVAGLRWTADVKHWSIRLDATLADVPNGAKLRVVLRSGKTILSDDSFGVVAGQVSRAIHLRDAGIDAGRNDLLWSPEHPVLIDAQITLIDEAGQALDDVQSYTAMRTVGTQGSRFMLNGRPVELRLLLDQGYWPATGMTAPDDDAFAADIRLVKSMGFNGVRKHQKIESERFLYLADKMGLFVWEEMPSAYAFSPLTVRRVMTQWMAAIERDASHPCIIVWVPMNESWAAPDLPEREDQRQFVRALYNVTKALDPTRPVISNDGWEMTQTDLINIHDYDHDPERLKSRYDATKRPIETILRTDRPGQRALLIDETAYIGQPLILSEFGGIALSADKAHTWGYSRATHADDLAKRYASLLTAVRAMPGFSGFCYTQFTDTYQEANGLVTMARKPKVEVGLIAIATRGPRDPAEQGKLNKLLEAGGL